MVGMSSYESQICTFLGRRPQIHTQAELFVIFAEFKQNFHLINTWCRRGHTLPWYAALNFSVTYTACCTRFSPTNVSCTFLIKDITKWKDWSDPISYLVFEIWRTYLYQLEACSLTLLSAATAAATEGGKCLKLPGVSCSSPPGVVSCTVVNRDSTSLSVNAGWSWFLVFPLVNESVFLLLFSLFMLSSTVFFTYNSKT